MTGYCANTVRVLPTATFRRQNRARYVVRQWRFCLGGLRGFCSIGHEGCCPKQRAVDLDSISIATATVYHKNGQATHYLSVSGTSWSGRAPGEITIKGKKYTVIRSDNRVLPDRTRKVNDGNSIQNNFNHAEKKLMSFITQQNQRNPNIHSVEIKIQNSNRDFPGACMGCGGGNGHGGSISDFQKRNMNIKINIEHGSK